MRKVQQHASTAHDLPVCVSCVAARSTYLSFDWMCAHSSLVPLLAGGYRMETHRSPQLRSHPAKSDALSQYTQGCFKMCCGVMRCDAMRWLSVDPPAPPLSSLVSRPTFLPSDLQSRNSNLSQDLESAREGSRRALTQHQAQQSSITSRPVSAGKWLSFQGNDQAVHVPGLWPGFLRC